MPQTISISIKDYQRLKNYVESAHKLIQAFGNFPDRQATTRRKKRPLITDAEATNYILNLYRSK